jgi:hypothetical protein
MFLTGDGVSQSTIFGNQLIKEAKDSTAEIEYTGPTDFQKKQS